jgi:uncharacterized protein YggU (UPF0235/DUF167 family)
VSGAGEVALAAAREGVVVPVAARPNGRREAIVGVRGGALLVETRAAPEAGAANEAIRRVLAAALGVPRAAVTLSAGGASRRKRFCVAGGERAAIAALLRARVAEER